MEFTTFHYPLPRRCSPVQLPGGTTGHTHPPRFIRADSSMIVGFSLDPPWGMECAPKEEDSFTREGNRRDPLIGVGNNSTVVGFCLVPDRACLIRATSSRPGREWPWGSGVSELARRFLGVDLVNNRADGPCTYDFSSCLSPKLEILHFQNRNIKLYTVVLLALCFLNFLTKFCHH